MTDTRLVATVSVLTALVLVGCTGSCRSNTTSAADRPRGVIFGWDYRGIAVIDIPTGHRTDLYPQQKGQWLTAATGDPADGTVYCVDTKSRSMLRLRGGDKAPETLYQYEEKAGIPYLELQGTRLTFYVRKWSSAGLWVFVVIDRDSGAAIHSIELSPGITPLGMVSDRECAVSIFPDRSDMKPNLGLLDVESGAVTVLRREVPIGPVLPGGKELMARETIAGAEQYAVYQLRSGRKIREVSDKWLPGAGTRATASVCPINTDFAAVGRRNDPMNPLGTYLLDLRTGGATKLTDSMLHNPQYFPDWPAGRP